jgi:hypothetical protein
MFKERKYTQALKAVEGVIAGLERKIGDQDAADAASRKRLSECFINKAVCLLSLDEGEVREGEVLRCLETAVRYDYLNYWAYFNLFSIHHQSYQYSAALDKLKCALSCLYLIKAVLSKDL